MTRSSKSTLPALHNLQQGGRTVFRGSKRGNIEVFHPKAPETSLDPAATYGRWMGTNEEPLNMLALVSRFSPSALAASLSALTVGRGDGRTECRHELPEGIVATSFGFNASSEGLLSDVLTEARGLRPDELMGLWVYTADKGLFSPDGFGFPVPGEAFASQTIEIGEGQRHQLRAGEVLDLAQLLPVPVPSMMTGDETRHLPFTGVADSGEPICLDGGHIHFDANTGETLALFGKDLVDPISGAEVPAIALTPSLRARAQQIFEEKNPDSVTLDAQWGVRAALPRAG